MKLRRGYSDVTAGQAHWRLAGTAGSARPLVCLHMVPKNSRSFQRVLPELARGRLVLAPDLPGHGASDPLPDGHSVPGYARWLWELLDELAMEGPVDLLGYHTGSMVAVAAATMRPDQVGRMINVSAPAFTREDLQTLGNYFQPIPLDEAGTRFSVMWERVLHHAGPGMTLEMAAASMADNLLTGEDYEEGHRAAFAFALDYLEQLAALPHPVLVMNIADDLYEATTRIDPHLRNGERRDYRQWGNGFLDLHGSEVAAEVLDFLDDRSPPGA